MASSRIILGITRATSIASRTSRTYQGSMQVSPHFFSSEVTPGIGKGKTSTGLVGLAVDHDAVPKMIVKYQALLDRIAESDMPENAQYRINVEQLARYRIKAAQENLDNPEKVEELCNCGQVEELVVQAENEMIVLNMYLKNRWWEYVKPVEVEYDPDESQDHADVDWEASPTKNDKA